MIEFTFEAPICSGACLTAIEAEYFKDLAERPPEDFDFPPSG